MLYVVYERHPALGTHWRVVSEVEFKSILCTAGLRDGEHIYTHRDHSVFADGCPLMLAIISPDLHPGPRLVKLVLCETVVRLHEFEAIGIDANGKGHIRWDRIDHLLNA